ncbi:MAG TPA: FAD binding domain-containing protein [Vicinamibacterales bacterium]|nr:FAD binding domain-containing protein [Vicinamibacterales bacterium]
MLRTFAYVRPGSVGEALEQLEERGARVHAGGTDLLGCLRDGVFEASKVVSLSRIGELRGITAAPDGELRIGALATIAALAAHPAVKERFTALADAASAVASPQLRNQGTLGGNLCQRPRCWYYRGGYDCVRKGGETCYAIGGENQYHAIFGGGACWIVHPSDTAPALMALDARVRLVGPKGARVLPLEKFYLLPDDDATKETVLEPGEIVLGVQVPPPAKGTRSAYRKVRARGSWDFAMAGLAWAIAMDDGRVADARLVLSGVAPAPWRLHAVEKLLIRQRLDAKTVARAAAAAVVGAKPLEQNAYKVPLVRGLVEDALGAASRA